MLRISTPIVEGLFQAAKWLKIQALIDVDELAALMQALGDFAIYPLSGALPMASFPMDKSFYLSTYCTWIEGLKEGIVPTSFGALNASMWSCSEDALWLQELPGKRYVARPRLPFLQVQVHQMGYSEVDRVFRPMLLSQESIFWGLQFSFPQVFEHPVKGFLEPKEFLNAHLFQIVRKWSRNYTMATPMVVEGVRQNIPIRLGKRCFSWINRHPQLKQRKLSVMDWSYAH